MIALVDEVKPCLGPDTARIPHKGCRYAVRPINTVALHTTYKLVKSCCVFSCER